MTQKKPGVLTAKQARFVDEYMIDLNATQSAIRAGYSKKTAEWIGPQLLGKSHVSAELAMRQQEHSKKSWLTREKVLSDIEAVKQDAMRKVCDKDGILVMANHAAALKAAELHGKHLGMFSDKLNVDGGISINVITGVPRGD